MFKLEQREYVQDISTEAGRNKRMEVLLRRMNIISRSETIASVVNESIKTIKLIVAAELADLLLFDRKKGTFRAPPLSKIKRDDEYGLSWSTQKVLAQKVLDTGQPVKLDNFTQAASFQNEGKEAIKQAICLPLKNGRDDVVGVLQIANLHEANALDNESITLLKILARHIACVIESIEQMNELEAKLREDELLMTEIHHRLKNNLSTVTSLIEVDLPEVNDQHAVDILQRTSSRIQSITQVHSLLYQLGTRKDVDLADYFRKLAEKIVKTLSNDDETVRITIQADDTILIDADRAMTCGLIMNELILNAYKHAFTSMKKGEVKIGMSEDKDQNIEIVVSDNGKGIGNNFAVEKKKSMGCWVIKALADRIDASINVSSPKGTRYLLKFAR